MNQTDSQAAKDVERRRIEQALAQLEEPSVAAVKKMCATGPEF